MTRSSWSGLLRPVNRWPSPGCAGRCTSRSPPCWLNAERSSPAKQLLPFLAFPKLIRCSRCTCLFRSSFVRLYLAISLLNSGSSTWCRAEMITWFLKIQSSSFFRWVTQGIVNIEASKITFDIYIWFPGIILSSAQSSASLVPQNSGPPFSAVSWAWSGAAKHNAPSRKA